MVWQAFADDSGNNNQQRVYTLSGFMAPAEDWARFSDAWQAQLDRTDCGPALEYFKFGESRRLREQFNETRGWTAALRDARVADLARTVTDHAKHLINAKIQHDHFDKLIKIVPVFQRSLSVDHPYILLVGGLVQAIGLIHEAAGLTEPIECIFDHQQGFETETHEIWREWRSSVRNRINGSQILGELHFRDDKEQGFLPLQAADMLAGAARHFHLTEERLPELETLLTLPGHSREYSGDEIRNLALSMTEEVFNIWDANPTYPHPREYDKSRARALRRKTRGDRGKP